MADIDNELFDIGIDKYDIQNEFINEIASKYFDLDDISKLKVGLFGYINELAATDMRNSIAHRNFLYDEAFLNTASLSKSIYNKAKSYNYEVPIAKPAKMTVTISMTEKDLLEYADEVETSDINNNNIKRYKFVIPKEAIFKVGDYNFCLENDIIINIQRLSTSKTNITGDYEYSYQARYDFSNNYSNVSVLDSLLINSYLKLWLDYHNDYGTIVTFQCQIWQMERQETTFDNFSSDLSDRLFFEVPYNNQLCKFDVNYRIGSSESTVLKGYFNDTFVPKDDYYYYYSYTNNVFNIFFSPLPGSFRPEISSSLSVTLYTTLGFNGNFNYYGNISLVFPNDRKYRNLKIAVLKVSNPSGGDDMPSMVETKQYLIKQFLARDNLITENDLNNYFNNLIKAEAVNSSEVLFIKRRDDILCRLYSVFMLLRDKSGLIIPTNTVDIDVDLDFHKYIYIMSNNRNTEILNEIENYEKSTYSTNSIIVVQVDDEENNAKCQLLHPIELLGEEERAEIESLMNDPVSPKTYMEAYYTFHGYTIYTGQPDTVIDENYITALGSTADRYFHSGSVLRYEEHEYIRIPEKVNSAYDTDDDKLRKENIEEELHNYYVTEFTDDEYRYILVNEQNDDKCFEINTTRYPFIVDGLSQEQLDQVNDFLADPENEKYTFESACFHLFNCSFIINDTTKSEIASTMANDSSLSYTDAYKQVCGRSFLEDYFASFGYGKNEKANELLYKKVVKGIYTKNLGYPDEIEMNKGIYYRLPFALVYKNKPFQRILVINDTLNDEKIAFKGSEYNSYVPIDFIINELVINRNPIDINPTPILDNNGNDVSDNYDDPDLYKFDLTIDSGLSYKDIKYINQLLKVRCVLKGKQDDHDVYYGYFDLELPNNPSRKIKFSKTFRTNNQITDDDRLVLIPNVIEIEDDPDPEAKDYKTKQDKLEEMITNKIAERQYLLDRANEYKDSNETLYQKYMNKYDDWIINTRQWFEDHIVRYYRDEEDPEYSTEKNVSSTFIENKVTALVNEKKKEIITEKVKTLLTDYKYRKVVNAQILKYNDAVVSKYNTIKTNLLNDYKKEMAKASKRDELVEAKLNTYINETARQRYIDDKILSLKYSKYGQNGEVSLDDVVITTEERNAIIAEANSKTITQLLTLPVENTNDLSITNYLLPSEIIANSIPDSCEAAALEYVNDNIETILAPSEDDAAILNSIKSQANSIYIESEEYCLITSVNVVDNDVEYSYSKIKVETNENFELTEIEKNIVYKLSSSEVNDLLVTTNEDEVEFISILTDESKLNELNYFIENIDGKEFYDSLTTQEYIASTITDEYIETLIDNNLTNAEKEYFAEVSNEYIEEQFAKITKNITRITYREEFIYNMDGEEYAYEEGTTEETKGGFYCNSELDMDIYILYNINYIEDATLSDKTMNPDFTSLHDERTSKMEDINEEFCVAVHFENIKKIKLFNIMNSVMHPVLTFKDYTKYNVNGFYVRHIPVLGYHYTLDYSIYKSFYSLFKLYYDIFVLNFEKLENNTTLDIKFYNTYGRSKHFSSFNTAFTLQFIIKLVDSYTKDLDYKIKKFIVSFVEKVNKTPNKIFAISNLVRELEKNFEDIQYIELVAIDDTQEQKIVKDYPEVYELTREQLINYVPEFLNIYIGKESYAGNPDDFKVGIKITYK